MMILGEDQQQMPANKEQQSSKGIKASDVCFQLRKLLKVLKEEPHQACNTCTITYYAWLVCVVFWGVRIAIIGINSLVAGQHDRKNCVQWRLIIVSSSISCALMTLI